MFSEQFPLITILTAVYNTGARMPDTLTSIKNQSYSNIQHIIIDDNSTDNSTEIVEKWINENNYSCLYMKHTVNLGICATINEALKLTNGKYFCVIGDDIMMPEKVNKDVSVLEENPEMAFCYSKMILHYADENREVKGNYKKSDNLFHEYLMGSTTIATPTVTYRRSIFYEVGVFDETLVFEDYDMFLRILYKHNVVFIDYYSIRYMIWEKSIQKNRQVEILREFLRILKKWDFLPKYKFYKNNRHQFTFCQLAVDNKQEALKHLLPALKVFWKPRLYKNLLKFLFVWN